MTRNLSFKQLFFILTLAFCGLLAASVLFAWTGPTASPPNNNVSAPVNVGTTDQVKNAGLSLNSLLVAGNALIYASGQTYKLGINRSSAVTALDVNGTLRIANGSEVCQSVTEGSQRYNSSTKTMQYCNGTAWGSLATTTSGGSTSSTSTVTLSIAPTVVAVGFIGKNVEANLGSNWSVVMIGAISGGGDAKGNASFIAKVNGVPTASLIANGADHNLFTVTSTKQCAGGGSSPTGGGGEDLCARISGGNLYVHSGSDEQLSYLILK